MKNQSIITEKIVFYLAPFHSLDMIFMKNDNDNNRIVDVKTSSRNSDTTLLIVGYHRPRFKQIPANHTL